MTTRNASSPTSTAVPGPREAFDEGTLHDLWLAGAEVHVDVTRPRGRAAGPGEVVVPESASSLVGSWDGYGV